MTRDDRAGWPRLRLEEETNSKPLIPKYQQTCVYWKDHNPTSAKKLVLSLCDGIPRRRDSKHERPRCLHCPVVPMVYTPTDAPHYPGHSREWRLAGCLRLQYPPSARSRSGGALDCIRHTQDTCGVLYETPLFTARVAYRYFPVHAYLSQQVLHDEAVEPRLAPRRLCHSEGRCRRRRGRRGGGGTSGQVRRGRRQRQRWRLRQKIEAISQPRQVLLLFAPCFLGLETTVAVEVVVVVVVGFFSGRYVYAHAFCIHG